MIKGFDKETCPLTEEEYDVAHKIAPFLLDKKGKNKSVTNKKMVNGIKSFYSVKITDARLRKIINYLRTHNVVPNLIATSQGYYVATSKEEKMEYIRGLEDRASAILEVAECLKKQTIK